MATKQEIAADIKKQYGPMLCQTQAREYLNGMSRTFAKEVLEAVPCFQFGKKKCYLAIDLAGMILQHQV